MDVRPIILSAVMLCLFSLGRPEPQAAIDNVSTPVAEIPQWPADAVEIEPVEPAVEQDDYATARALAMQTGRPLFVMVEADGCLPCAMMERDTIKPMLASDEFQGSIVVRVNMTRQPALAAQLRVEAAPTLLVYHYRDGAWAKELRVVGNVGKEVVRKMLGVTRGVLKLGAKVVTAPVRAVAKVRDNYRARWQNYDGLSDEEHSRIMHGIDTRGKSAAELARMRDADHDRYGAGHPPAMRNRTTSRPIAVSASCPTCPTSVSYSKTSVATSRASSCPGGVCPTSTRRGLFGWRR